MFNSGGWMISTNASYSSLLAYYPLTKNANDYSKRQVNGISNNGVVYNGSYAYFDGINDWVNIGNSSSFSPTTGEITFSYWVKTLDNAYEIFSNWFGSGFNGLNIGQYNTTKADFFIGSSLHLISTTSINTNTWYHVVGTWSGITSSANLYINGIKEAYSTAAPLSLSYTSNFTDGNVHIGNCTSGGYFFNGSIANLRIYNKALSDTEILQLYNSEKYIQVF